MVNNLITNGNYDINRIWELHNKKTLSKSESDEYHGARKNNVALNRALYDYDKAKVLKEIAKAQNILEKILKGEELTEEEKKEFQNSPDLQIKGQILKNEKESLEQKIKNVSSKDDIKKILNFTQLNITSKKDTIAIEDTVRLHMIDELSKEHLGTSLKENEEQKKYKFKSGSIVDSKA